VTLPRRRKNWPASLKKTKTGSGVRWQERKRDRENGIGPTAPRRILHIGHDREDSGRDKHEAQRAMAARRDLGDKNENHERREVNWDRGPSSGKRILCSSDAQIEAKAQTEAEDPRAGTKMASAAVAESENQKIFSANTEKAAQINQIWLTSRIDGDSEAPSKNWTGKTKENMRARETNHERIPHAGTGNETRKQRPDPVK
jgi:hypothetical protein